MLSKNIESKEWTEFISFQDIIDLNPVGVNTEELKELYSHIQDIEFSENWILLNLGKHCEVYHITDFLKMTAREPWQAYFATSAFRAVLLQVSETGECYKAVIETV